jgi:HNH endonuclease
MKVYNHSLIWSVIYRYFPEIELVIKSENINTPINVMSLDAPMHRLFGSFRLAFEGTVCFYGQRATS